MVGMFLWLLNKNRCDFVLHFAGSFRGLRFRPARCRELSQIAIPSCTLQEAFAALLPRKVSIIGGTGNGLAGKI